MCYFQLMTLPHSIRRCNVRHSKCYRTSSCFLTSIYVLFRRHEIKFSHSFWVYKCVFQLYTHNIIIIINNYIFVYRQNWFVFLDNHRCFTFTTKMSFVHAWRFIPLSVRSIFYEYAKCCWTAWNLLYWLINY